MLPAPCKKSDRCRSTSFHLPLFTAVQNITGSRLPGCLGGRLSAYIAEL